jgi:two-component system, NtrC family, sensor histidine kinase HydH
MLTLPRVFTPGGCPVAASISLLDVPKRFDLTKRFAVLSFICIAIFAAALCWLASRYLANEMLDREWETTAQYIRTETRRTVGSAEFKAADPDTVMDKFDSLHRRITAMPDITRIKIYNAAGVIIWSDERRLIGSTFPDNDELQEALEGKVVTEISGIGKQENIFERASYNRLAEVYVPIYSENGKDLVGVIESYKSVDTLYRDIHRAQLAILAASAVGGLLLYVSLFVFVRQAARKIEDQQQNLIQMQTELVASQRMAAIGEMAAAVAHGIGNPLSSIRASAQLAKLDCKDCCEQKLQDKTVSTLNGIMQQVDRVQRRMRGLLNFVRPLEPEATPVDIDLLLHDSVDVLRPRYEQAGVGVHLELQEHLPKLNLDANHMEQVFQGLLTNALEATPHGGSVTVRTTIRPNNGKGRLLSIDFEDTGEGIPAENRERVFEPFFTTKPTGTGIGLALAKKFVERNGGSIAIADGADGGTRIELTFPILH